MLPTAGRSESLERLLTSKCVCYPGPAGSDSSEEALKPCPFNKLFGVILSGLELRASGLQHTDPHRKRRGGKKIKKKAKADLTQNQIPKSNSCDRTFHYFLNGTETGGSRARSVRRERQAGNLETRVRKKKKQFLFAGLRTHSSSNCSHVFLQIFSSAKQHFV